MQAHTWHMTHHNFAPNHNAFFSPNPSASLPLWLLPCDRDKILSRASWRRCQACRPNWRDVTGWHDTPQGNEEPKGKAGKSLKSNGSPSSSWDPNLEVRESKGRWSQCATAPWNPPATPSWKTLKPDLVTMKCCSLQLQILRELKRLKEHVLGSWS